MYNQDQLLCVVIATSARVGVEFLGQNVRSARFWLFLDNVGVKFRRARSIVLNFEDSHTMWYFGRFFKSLRLILKQVISFQKCVLLCWGLTHLPKIFLLCLWCGFSINSLQQTY